MVGICAAVERVSWGVWDGYEVTLAPRNYVRALQGAGAIAIVLPPDEVVEHYLNRATVEIEAFEAAVTDWERYRGFERL